MDGFTSIVGIAFGKSGVLYVSEIVKKGVLALPDLVQRSCHKTELVRGRLTLPGDVAVGRDGTQPSPIADTSSPALPSVRVGRTLSGSLPP